MNKVKIENDKLGFFCFMLCVVYYLLFIWVLNDPFSKLVLLMSLTASVVFSFWSIRWRNNDKLAEIYIEKDVIIVFTHPNKINQIKWEDVIIGKDLNRFLNFGGHSFRINSKSDSSFEYLFSLELWTKKSMILLVKENVPKNCEFYKKIASIYHKEFTD